MDEIKPDFNSNDAFSDLAENSPVAENLAPTAPSVRRVTVKRPLKRPVPMSKNLTIWLTLPLVFLVGLSTGWLLWGQAPTSNSQVTVNQNVQRYNVATDNDPSLGPKNAPVTIVEFSDFQCPYCISWYQQVYKRLLIDYKDKIRFVYKDFPLYSIHPEAGAAAEAANCAGQQDAYWKYHDALFEGKNGLGTAAYTQYATELGLNVDLFNKCMSEHLSKKDVDADYKYGSSLGVSSTPTFFVNGLAVVGAQPYEVFQQIIDKELAGEIPK